MTDFRRFVTQTWLKSSNFIFKYHSTSLPWPHLFFLTELYYMHPWFGNKWWTYQLSLARQVHYVSWVGKIRGNYCTDLHKNGHQSELPSNHQFDDIIFRCWLDIIAKNSRSTNSSGVTSTLWDPRERILFLKTFFFCLRASNPKAFCGIHVLSKEIFSIPIISTAFYFSLGWG